ncbi:MAG: leucine-rich repeat domain-containing protein [Promethearchaeota archaeon]
MSIKELIKKEFKVNEYLTLRLIKDKTFIFIKGELFQQCKYLLMDIPKERLNEIRDIESIDEASSILDHSLEKGEESFTISPEMEFWGHCSNLQVWAENNYDTRLLHSNIAFPLLKKLTDVGDPTAKKVFKEEIGLRISHGNEKVIEFLVSQNYLDYLNEDEISAIGPELKQFVYLKQERAIGNYLDKNEFESLFVFIVHNTDSLRFFATHPFSKMDELTRESKQAVKVEKKKIVGLSLNYCRLNELSPLIENLKNLKILYLNNNFFKNFPESILNLKKLEEISLAGNQLRKIPPSIDQLKNLRIFNLDHGAINVLPDSITELSFLESLSLWNNALKTLPKDLGKLKRLKILGLSNNRLQELPPSIKELTSLKTIDLSTNLFSKFPEELIELNALESLWMNQNKIKSLPSSILNMDSLKELFLINNPLNVHSDVNLKIVVAQLKARGVIVRL